MSCLRINSHRPACHFNASFPSLAAPKRSTFSSTYMGKGLPKISLKAQVGASTTQRRTTVCLFGGKNNASNDNEASPWKALEKAVGNLRKEQSVEDLLKQQIQKQEYYEGGSGGGGNGPGGGGGGGYGFGETEDEGISGILDELGQVILATMGFIFLYIYIIDGEQITAFARDILKFIFLRKKSIRLARTIARWENFFRSLTETEEEDPYWLEREILNTSTWYDGPDKYNLIRRLVSDSYY